MTSAHDMLVSYSERRSILKSYYYELRREFQRQVEELKNENAELISTDLKELPDLNFQFFEVDNSNSTHFRIVGAMGTIVVMLDALQVNIGSFVHLHNDGELGDISSTYKIAEADDGLACMYVDRNAERPVFDLEREVRYTLKELLFPTVTSERIRATPQARV